MKYMKGYGIEIKEIEGKGRGVFATKPFNKGDSIEIAPTLVLNQSDSDAIRTTKLDSYHYCLTVGEEGLPIDNHGDDNGEAVIGLGFTSLYNHHKQPNADYVVTRDKVYIIALREILPNEEITINYMWPETLMIKNGMQYA